MALPVFSPEYYPEYIGDGKVVRATAFPCTDRPYLRIYYPADRARLLRGLYIFSIIFFLVTGTAAFLFSKSLLSLAPEASISNASFSSFRLSVNNLTADFHIAFSVKNPNTKMNLFFSRVRARLSLVSSPYHKNCLVFQNEFPPFELKIGDAATMWSNVTVKNFSIDGDLAGKIAIDRTMNRTLLVSTNFYFHVAYRTEKWSTKMHTMETGCAYIALEYDDDRAAGALRKTTVWCEVLP